MNVKPRALPHARAPHASPHRLPVLLVLSALFLCAASVTSGQAQTPPAPTAQTAGTNDVAALDIPALLREVARSERAMTPRRFEYTWTMKVTNREVNKRGEVTKEEVKVYEAYPVRGELVTKLVSENGVAIPPQKADEQLKKAVANLEKAAREDEQRRAAAPPQTPPAPADPNLIPSFGAQHRFGFRSGFSNGAFAFALWRFFRACEFYAPRHEQLRGRDTLVLDFRPRADFQPADDLQKPYAKLAGRVWLDLNDKAVARLMAWPATQTAGTNATPPADPAIVYEETRLPDGLWVESLVRINTNGNRPGFNGVDVDVTKEMSDFKRFQTTTDDAQVAAPKPPL